MSPATVIRRSSCKVPDAVLKLNNIRLTYNLAE